MKRSVQTLSWLLPLVVACSHSDVGTPCPAELVAGLAPAVAAADGVTSKTGNLVAQSPLLPCADLTCVAAQGSGPYCSHKCLDDAACPTGFACRQVQPLGAFAQDRFCVFKTCSTAHSCGDVDRFCCQQVVGGTPTQEIHLCALKTGKTCPT